jgi:hypothetical protein
MSIQIIQIMIKINIMTLILNFQVYKFRSSKNIKLYQENKLNKKKNKNKK